MNRPLLPPVALLAALLLAAPARAQAPILSWTDRYDGPASLHDDPVQLALGADGLFVLGTSNTLTGQDFTLLKYAPGGELAWARQYDGPGHSVDRASAVLPDGEGGAFVCGRSWGGLAWQAALLHYDGSGNLLWVRSFATPSVFDVEGGPRLARAPDGGVRMGLTAEGNFLVAAFGGDGTPLWTRALDVVPGEDDFLSGIAVDWAGNTVVVGPVGDGLRGYETVMLDAGGNVVWTDNQSGVFGSTLGPAFLALDKGEIVVTGVPESDCGVFQTRTWRLTSGGTRLWTRDFPTGFCDTARAVDMALDGEGNALVLCQSTILAESTSSAFTVLKYSPEGRELWRRSLAFAGEDFPRALDVDRAGNAYFVGSSMLPPRVYDGVAASYAPDGSLRWIRIFGAEAPGRDPAHIVAGPRGELYLSGAAFFQDTTNDILTARLQQAARFAVPR